jgi:hypothetical protein
VSDHKITAEERALAEEVGLSPQPEPVHNEMPSAHELAIQSLRDRFEPDAVELTDEGLRRMYTDLLEMYVVLNGGRDEAIKELRKRKAFGEKKYGTPLQPRNNRDQIADARDEMGDLIVYMACAIWERMYPKPEEAPSEDSNPS